MAVAADFTAEQIRLHDLQRELGPEGDRQLAALFAEQFPIAGLILDAGGGSGTAVPALTRAGLRVLLVDLSAAMLRAGAAGAVARADLRALPLPDGSVDGVHAAFVLQNIPQWTRAVAEITRVLLPSGTVLVAWGQPAVDPLVAAVREQFLHALHETEATVGVAASATGLDSIDAGHAAFADYGLAARSQHRVPGRQTRTVRQLVASWAGNPFISGASPEQRGEAAQRTLSWATARLGDVDVPHALRVELRLHGYRRG